VATSGDRVKKLGTDISNTQHPSSGGKLKSYYDIDVGREINNKVKIKNRSKGNQAPETIKELIKKSKPNSNKSRNQRNYGAIRWQNPDRNRKERGNRWYKHQHH